MNDVVTNTQLNASINKGRFIRLMRLAQSRFTFSKFALNRFSRKQMKYWKGATCRLIGSLTVTFLVIPERGKSAIFALKFKTSSYGTKRL